MKELLSWLGLFLAIFLGVVLLGNDCENANKARSRLGRWLDSDLPAQHAPLDAGARDR